MRHPSAACHMNNFVVENVYEICRMAREIPVRKMDPWKCASVETDVVAEPVVLQKCRYLRILR